MTKKIAALAIFMGLMAVSPATAEPGNVEVLPPRGTAYRWTADQQIVGYRERTKIDPVRVVGASRWAHGQRLPVAVHQISPHWTWNGQAMDVNSYMEASRVSGIVVIKDGQVLLERYGLGRTEDDYWDGQSTTKSVTAILLGAAIQDGYIKSMDALVTDHIPELKSSAYGGVTIRQLATMSSGVKFDDDYINPSGDGFKLWSEPVINGVNPTVAYTRRLPRADKPGAKFHYKDIDTDLVGILVSKAVGKSLSAYLSEKIWQPYGMEKDAFWMVDSSGTERGNCCLSTTLRDFARIGQFVLGGGKAGGVQVLPTDWLAEATSAQVTQPESQRDGRGIGYGYFWWIFNDSHAARGHAGQAIYVYPKDKIVIAINSAWLGANQPNRPDYQPMLNAFVGALHKAAVAHR